MKCSNCGTDNPEEAKFCYNCGKPLGEIKEELKLASILVLDLKNYSQILSKLGVDDTAELIKELFNILEKEVEKYGGRIIKFLGDGFISAFGVPKSFENFADGAILASLSILNKVREIKKDIPELSLKIAISTGKVWQGMLKGELDLLGDPVNEGVYLQNFCPLDRVIVTSNTLKLASKRFLYKKLGKFNIQKLNKEVEAYLVIGERKERKNLIFPFVGRKKELKNIENILRKIEDKGVLILIEGEEGIGKSRLIKEVKNKFQNDFIWYKGRAYSYTSNFPYYPILEIIKSIWKIKDNEVEEKIERKLKKIFAKREIIIPLEYYKSLILNFLFLSKKDLLSQWDQSSKEQLWKILLEEIFISTYKDKPVIFVFDDLHWGDASTIRVLREIVNLRKSFPISFILIYRTNEVLRKTLKGLCPDLYIYLNPLSFEEAKELLNQIVPNLNIRMIDEIVRRLGRKPLFLEEISGIIKERNFKVEEILNKIPDNIYGIMQTRIDSLDSLAKNILCWASIVGKRFSLNDIIYFSKGEYSIDEIKSTLSKLQKLRFIRRERDDLYTLYEKALNICERIKYFSGIAHSLCNIGTCYLAMENLGLAERYIKRAVELWESLGVEEWLILALIYLSSAQIKGNKLEEAEKTLKRVGEKLKNKRKIPERKLFEKNLIYLEFKKE